MSGSDPSLAVPVGRPPRTLPDRRHFSLVILHSYKIIPTHPPPLAPALQGFLVMNGQNRTLPIHIHTGTH